MRLSELWLERWVGPVSIRFGQLAADAEFFYSDLSQIFLQSDWATITAVNLPGGGPAYPLSAVGARIKYEFPKDASFLFAIFNGDPAGPCTGDPDTCNRYGLNFRMSDPAFMSARALRLGLPIVVLALVVLCWDLLVRAFAIPPYVLPSPGLVLATLIADAGLLWRSLLVTLTLTFEGFLLAAVGGILLAIAFNQWRLVDYSLYPYAVILQVTPIVAIAPLLLIYLPQPLAVLVCAWIVAFFPVLANTTLGLNSVDHNLLALFELYKASRWQVLWNLKLPSALPQMLTGLRIAGGLSLIGAVVAEIAAGSAGAGSGLAYRIAESGYRLNIPRMWV